MFALVAAETDPFAAIATAAADELEGMASHEAARRRLLNLPRYVARYGDVLAEALEELVEDVHTEDPRLAARLSGLLADALLAEEGFTRRFWRAFRAHLRLLREAGDVERAGDRLRETLVLAAAFG